MPLRRLHDASLHRRTENCGSLERWSYALNPWVFLILVFFVITLTYFARRYWPKSKHLTHAEYWVFIPKPELPKIEKLMDRMLQANPHNRPGRSCITTREGMLFTDIRLHSALALRSKNVACFRPDLFSSTTEVEPEALKLLSDCEAFVKVRYVSEAPLPDKRHLQFLPHYADAMAELAEGKVVFDSICERLITAVTFHQELKDAPNHERMDKHFRITAKQGTEEWTLSTKGLRKIGSPELIAHEIPSDERQTVHSVLEEISGRIWEGHLLGAEQEVELYGSKFKVRVAKQSLVEAEVTIQRVVIRSQNH